MPSFDYYKYWGNPPWEQPEEEEDDDEDEEDGKYPASPFISNVNTHNEYEMYTGKKWEEEEETDEFISGDELRDHWIGVIKSKVYSHNTSLFWAWVVIAILVVLQIFKW